MANTEVGTAYVAIIPSARGFAKTLQRDIAKEFSGSNLDKLISDALGERKPLKLPVQPVMDPSSIPDELPARDRKPLKLPVELDPLVREFQAEVKRQVAALSRQVNAEIPVVAGKDELRSELAAEIAGIERQLKVEVPTEPGDRRGYEARLRAMVAEVQSRVKAEIDVDVDVDRQGGVSRLTQSLAGLVPKTLTSGLKEIGSAASAAAGSAVQLGSSFIGALTSAGGAIGAAISAVAGMTASVAVLASVVTFTVPGIVLLGGAIGALPAVTVGAGAAFGALALGLKGVADHFKDTSKGAGAAGASVAAQARQIASANRGIEAAERGLARAQREAKDAQEDLTRARKAAQDRIEDLARSVRGAQLDERDATLRVLDAQDDLNRARKSRDPREIERAQIAYEQSVLALENAKDATKDLTVEQQQAAKAGVQGSTEVQAALQRQQDATDGLKSATDSLTSAQEALAAAKEKTSGGGGVADDLIKLAPSAQQFVDQVKALKPAFESLRLDVQEKLFSGLSGSVKDLATAWLPQLHKTLGDYAATFNGLLKTLTGSLSQKSFIDNMGVAAEATRTALEKIGKAVTGPLVDAFGKLSKAAKPFIDAFGDEVSSLITDFSAWIDKADKSGKLNEFFQKAGDFLRDVFDMGRDVASIIGSIFKTLFDSGDTTTSPWDGLKDGLDRLAKWFADPKNQEQMRGWIQDIKDAVLWVKQFIAGADEFLRKVGGFKDSSVSWFGAVKDAVMAVNTPLLTILGTFKKLNEGATSAIGGMVATAKGLPGQISNAVGGLGTLLYNAGKNVIQGLIDGMKAMFASLGRTSGAAAQLVRSYWPFSPAKTGPLSGSGALFYAGQHLVGDLSRGMSSQMPALSAASTQLAETVIPDLSVGGATTGFSVPAAPAAPQPGALTVEWVGGAGDAVVRGIKDHVRIYYKGSPDVAFGKAR